MLRLHLSPHKTCLLSAVSLMLTGGAASAQVGGLSNGVNNGGFHTGGMGNLYGSGFNRGTGYNSISPYGRGYNAGYGRGSSYGQSGRGSAANLGFGNGYGSNRTVPPFLGSTGRNLYRTPTIQGYLSGSPLLSQPRQAEATPKDNAAHLLVVVPAHAELWFNGRKTKHTGRQRAFVSPPLTQGKNYTYDIRVRWTENGKPVEQTRSVRVQANSWQKIDFSQAEAAAAN